MLEESVSTSSPTFWSSLTSWFTPTIFFLLLQLVIATIFITSSLSNNRKHQHQHEHQQDPHETTHHFQRQQQEPLARSPSLLQRLKSINFYYHPHTTSHHETQQQQPQILRSPSSVLQRLKSINLYTYLPSEPLSSYFTTDTNLEPHEKPHVRETPPPQQQQQKQQDQEEEEEEHEEDDDVVGEIHNKNNLGVHVDEEGEFGNSTMDEIFSKLQEGQGGNFTRTQSDTKPASGEVPVRLPRKMKKSATTKSAFSHFEEADIMESRGPATARDGGAASSTAAEEDGGVDAKADDFINRFKQQLKLQRLDSIMRYKEMIGGGK